MITWQRALGRQHVNPTEITTLLLQNNIPVEGSDLWTASRQSDANAVDTAHARLMGG